jgi:WD40 repeat protein
MEPGGPGEVVERQVSGAMHRVAPVYSPQSDLVACASGAQVLVLSKETGEAVAVLTGHKRPVSCLAFTGNHRLLSGSLDGECRAACPKRRTF